MEPPYLQIVTPPGRAAVPLGPAALTIGRHKDNHMALPQDDLASRFHGVIEKTASGYQLRDLGSRNGTKVNGVTAKDAVLKHGDRITIGRAVLEVVLPAVAKVEAPRTAKVLTRPPLSAKEEVLEINPAQIIPEIIIGPAPEEELEEIDDPIATLRRLAEAIPDQPFTENDIVLTNARGGIMHPAVSEHNERSGGPETVTLFRLLLLLCFRSRASDIHIEPKESHFQIRIRVDGAMLDITRISRELGIRVMAMVKVLGDIDIAQRNIVQEGHFSSRVPAGEAGSDSAEASSKAGIRRVDYRVSLAPSVYGQKLVIRIQDTAQAPLLLTTLGLPPWMAEELARVIQLDAGMILAVGPTGSGKTTTLYALLRSLNVSDRNVVTIEDPVEIEIEGITQLPVNENDEGKSFSGLLKSTLRQDPDVILIGEIRDSETARTALQAAITGHLVFSTLHTKDSVGCIFRLLDLGVEPYMLNQGLQTILAQRLVRQLCPRCKKPSPPTAAQAAKLEQHGLQAERLFAPRGCPRCLQTGFLGRRAIFELLTMTDDLRDVIGRAPSLRQIQDLLAGTPFVKLQTSAYELVAQGLMHIDEVDKTMSR